MNQASQEAEQSPGLELVDGIVSGFSFPLGLELGFEVITGSLTTDAEGNKLSVEKRTGIVIGTLGQLGTLITIYGQ